MARENAVAAGARQLWREIVQIRAAVRWLGNDPVDLSDPLGLQQTPKLPPPNPGYSWWNDLKNLAKDCWKDPFGCGVTPVLSEWDQLHSTSATPGTSLFFMVPRPITRTD